MFLFHYFIDLQEREVGLQIRYMVKLFKNINIHILDLSPESILTAKTNLVRKSVYSN